MFIRQPLLLIGVKQHMVGHHHLRTVGHHDVRRRNAVIRYALNFGNQLWNIKRNTVANNIHRVLIAYAGGQKVQRKTAVVVDDRVPCVRTALKTDDDIRFAGKQIGNFPLALIAPICTDNRFHHVECTSIKLGKHAAKWLSPAQISALKKEGACKQKYSLL